MASYEWHQPSSKLPDPDQHPEFYEMVGVRRGVALLIDATILVVLAVVLAGATGAGLMLATVTFGFLLLFLPLAYHALTPLILESATPGMWMMGLELRDRHGLRFDWQISLMHTVCFLGLCLMTPLILVNVGVMVLSRTGRGLHDRLLGTAVIRRPA